MAVGMAAAGATGVVFGAVSDRRLPLYAAATTGIISVLTVAAGMLVLIVAVRRHVPRRTLPRGWQRRALKWILVIDTFSVLALALVAWPILAHQPVRVILLSQAGLFICLGLVNIAWVRMRRALRPEQPLLLGWPAHRLEAVVAIVALVIASIDLAGAALVH